MIDHIIIMHIKKPDYMSMQVNEYIVFKSALTDK